MGVKDLYDYLQSGNYPERFKHFQKFIFDWEVVNKAGSIAVENDPSDPGGKTLAGLDARSHPSLNFARMTPKDVCDAYLEEWTKEGIEQMPEKLGECFFNAAVNCGTGRAKAIAAKVSSAAQFVREQASFYERLATSKPSLRKFLGGWENRLNALKHFLEL